MHEIMLELHSNRACKISFTSEYETHHKKISLLPVCLPEYHFINYGKFRRSKAIILILIILHIITFVP